MATVTRMVRAPAEQVYAILADGWTYSDWVVGTAHIRHVDAAWPELGSRLHHKVGPWPVSIHDKSTVTAVDPGRMLALRAGLWPLGEAAVRITLEPGGAGQTQVTMSEDFRAGPLRWVRNKINDLVLHRRNVEALRRLAELAERSRP
ncbi:SRPBCC family protein [Actinoplanes sp. NPDC049668]|uniref:SRPBCC family protein n=1 Tax=unclassified Actinoplanes TaxID=2626549 RepID=UPI0033A6573C